MATIVQFDFPHPGPWGAAQVEPLREHAESIAAEPGLVWKSWIENEAEGIAGGIYYFVDEPSALAYKEMHEKRLAASGVENLSVRVFTVNEALSAITRFPNV